MKSTVLKTAGMALFVLGLSAVAQAAIGAAPEIDAAAGANALALLAGAVLMIRGRKK